MPELSALAPAAAILALAAITQGFFGFGFGIVAMSGLTLSRDLLHAGGVVNLTGLVLTGSLLWQLRGGVLWAVLGRMAPAVLVGVAVGVTALRQLDATLLVRTLGASIIAIALWNLTTRRQRQHEMPRTDVAVGLLGGLLGGAFNTGGPPLVAHLFRRGESPEALKATVQALFLTIGLSRLPLAVAQGLITEAIWWEAALAAPFVLVGAMAGLALSRRVSAERFRSVGWLALGALGAALLISA